MENQSEEKLKQSETNSKNEENAEQKERAKEDRMDEEKENVENQAEMNEDAKSGKEENADSQKEMDEYIKAINEDFKSRKADLEGDLTKKEKAGHTKTIDEDKRSGKDDLKRPGNRNYLSYHIYQGEWRPTRALRAVGAAHVGPGPNAVNLPPTIGDHDHDPRKIKAPAYVIGLKDSHVYIPCAPGSETYDTRLLTNKGRDECRAPKIGEKLAGLTTFMPPGPFAYHRGESDGAVFKSAPAYSMQFCKEPAKAFQSPSPNLYTLPESLGKRNTPFSTGPAYSIGDRLDKTGTPQKSPGPEAYHLPSSNAVKQKPPSYSMGIRPMSETIGPASPGPASNELHLVRELFH
ncbi:outer dense fiber protein 3 [Caerostris darwini]|uniref:Outer dense fiber protein 3 n=1 Tax=Caerostris darwini TaxID=1538125 RepID=A0AAV4QE77_9ARAC|nr:outer dense fiber protein 3 [Caerostris darwini]